MNCFHQKPFICYYLVYCATLARSIPTLRTFWTRTILSSRPFMLCWTICSKNCKRMVFAKDTKHAEISSKEDEIKLWETKVIGTENPKALLRVVFYLNGKNFCLRGDQEHRNLKLSQLVKCTSPSLHYLYLENSSKNPGGLAHFKQVAKRVPIYSNSKAGYKCHIHILDLYFSKLPPDAWKKDYFYARPLPNVPSDPDKPWFSPVPVGKNMLATMLKNMCNEAQIDGRKANHSLHSTGASELFQAGVPEKIIKERTGHHSLEALQTYERTTTEQQQAISDILSAEKKITFQQALHSKQSISQQHSIPIHIQHNYGTMSNLPQLHFQF